MCKRSIKLSHNVAECLEMCGVVVVLARHHSKVKELCDRTQSVTKGLDRASKSLRDLWKTIFPQLLSPLEIHRYLWKTIFPQPPSHFENWLEALDKSRNPCYYEFKKTEKSRKTRNLKILKNTKS